MTNLPSFLVLTLRVNLYEYDLSPECRSPNEEYEEVDEALPPGNLCYLPLTIWTPRAGDDDDDKTSSRSWQCSPRGKKSLWPIPMVGNGYSYGIGYGGKCWDGWVSLKASLLRAPYGVNKVGTFVLFSP